MILQKPCNGAGAAHDACDNACGSACHYGFLTASCFSLKVLGRPRESMRKSWTIHPVCSPWFWDLSTLASIACVAQINWERGVSMTLCTGIPRGYFGCLACTDVISCFWTEQPATWSQMIALQEIAMQLAQCILLRMCSFSCQEEQGTKTLGLQWLYTQEGWAMMSMISGRFLVSSSSSGIWWQYQCSFSTYQAFQAQGAWKCFRTFKQRCVHSYLPVAGFLDLFAEITFYYWVCDLFLNFIFSFERQGWQETPSISVNHRTKLVVLMLSIDQAWTGMSTACLWWMVSFPTKGQHFFQCQSWPLD